MHCNRCDYKIGITETRCRVCGHRVPRLRSGIVALVSLTSGVTVGWFLIALLRM